MGKFCACRYVSLVSHDKHFCSISCDREAEGCRVPCSRVSNVCCVLALSGAVNSAPNTLANRISSGILMLLTKSVGTSVTCDKQFEVAANAPVALVQAIPAKNGASFQRQLFAVGFADILWAIDMVASRFAIAPLITTSYQSNPIFECIRFLILLGSMY